MNGDGSQVRDPTVLTEHAAVESLTAFPAPQFTAHDAWSTTLATSLLHVLSACAYVTDGIMYETEAPVTGANVPSEHAAVELAVSPAGSNGA